MKKYVLFILVGAVFSAQSIFANGVNVTSESNQVKFIPNIIKMQSQSK